MKSPTDRYVAQWNEPDPAARSTLFRGLRAHEGTQVLLDPPEEIRQAATSPAFPAPGGRGHVAVGAARVSRAYEMFAAPGEHVFEVGEETPGLLPNVIGVCWSMVSTRSGEAVGGALNIPALDQGGRIRSGHQFIGVN